eukprot:216671-Karenia_brevis.AAC.1
MGIRMANVIFHKMIVVELKLSMWDTRLHGIQFPLIRKVRITDAGVICCGEIAELDGQRWTA